MNVEVNWIAVLLAAASSMVVGGVWYAKSMFGTVWMKLTGLNEKTMNRRPFGPMLLAVLGGLLTAYVLAYSSYVAHEFFQNSFFMDAINTAFWLWLGISLTTIVIHYSFERRPWKLAALAAGHQLVTLLLMGAIIGLIKP